MTTIIKASEIEQDKRVLLKKFTNDLVIKSVNNEPYKKKYTAQTKIQLFEINDDEFIIPFFYHQTLLDELNYEDIFANDDIEYTGKIFEFTGSLLPRQEEIKYEILH